MDIKSKNRHKISILLAIAIVVTASMIMVGLYPFFEKESKRHEEPVYQDEGFLRHMIAGNYVLALEQAQYEQKTMISPFQFFFPQAELELNSSTSGNYPAAAEEAVQEALTGSSDANESEIEIDSTGDYRYYQSDREEYLRSLRQSSVVEFERWNRYFNSIRNSIDYQVLNENGRVLTDHAGGRSILESDEYTFKAVLHYDELGRMDVTAIRTDYSTDHILSFLQEFGESDPMGDFYQEEYTYEPGLKLRKPQNMTFAYGMTSAQAAGFAENRGTFWNSYYNSGIVARVFLGLACGVFVFSFFFYWFDLKWTEDKKLLRTPFECVAIADFCAIGFGIGLTSLVAATNKGDLYGALLRAEFMPEVADFMIRLWNVLWWSVPFGVIYWSVLCLSDVFHIGLKRYVRERTLTGRFCQRLKGLSRRLYEFVSAIDLQERTDRSIFRIVGVNFIILAVLCSLWFFGIAALIVYSMALFVIMRKFYKDLSDKYRILLKATNQIAEGNLEVSIEEDLGVFEPFKKEIQKIQSGFKVAVDEEVKSQKLKTDLISNMSHDLKTPLTAIITYVNLLKDENTTVEQRSAYIDVLEQKSMRLKSLIEDLFEISKANSNNVTLNLVNVDIVSLLKEVSLELSDKIEESTIDFRWNLPEEKIVLPLDSQKTYRIFDNLLTNIIKYAMPHTRAYVDMKEAENYVTITLKNISAAELTFNPEDITERFARGDESRNTEGSGLGLAIAKSFVELQNGKLFVEVEADLFRVIIRWPVP